MLLVHFELTDSNRRILEGHWIIFLNVNSLTEEDGLSSLKLRRINVDEITLNKKRSGIKPDLLIFRCSMQNLQNVISHKSSPQERT
jgi:hypothetical protein